ncbi:hypothetical protein Tco_0880685, partial [Tanacetum coccineum]
PGNIVNALGGKGRRKENNFSKEVVFTKADEFSSEPAPKITSDSKTDCDIQEPLPALVKLIGTKLSGTSNSLISLSDLTSNMAELTLNNSLKRSKKSFVKVLQTYVIKKTELKITSRSLQSLPHLVLRQATSCLQIKRSGLDHVFTVG